MVRVRGIAKIAQVAAAVMTVAANETLPEWVMISEQTGNREADHPSVRCVTFLSACDSSQRS